MEQVKNDISAADSSSALVADFSATSSNLFQQQVAEEVAAKVVEEIVAEAATAETAEVAQDVTVEAFNNVARGTTNKNGAMRSVFPFFPQDKSIQRKRCLEARETPIDVVIPLHKSTCQGINVNNACVAEETLIFEIAPATDMSSIGTEMSATEEFPATEEITAAGIIPAVEVPEVEHMGSEVEVIPSTEIEDDIPDIEGTFAQDPNDNAPLEDMADVHDSYDAVLADVQEENVQAAVPELEVTSPAIKNASPTKTGVGLHTPFSLLVFLTEIAHFIRTRREIEPVRRVVAPRMAHLYGPGGMRKPVRRVVAPRIGSLIRTRRDAKTRPPSCGTENWLTYTDPADEKPVRRVVAPSIGSLYTDPAGCENPSAELWHRELAHLYGPGGMRKPVRRVVAPRIGSLIRTRRDAKTRPPSCGTENWLTYTDPAGCENPSAELWHRKWIHVIAGSGNEFAAEDEGDFDAVEAAESASAAIQSPFASLERLGVEISTVPAEILSFFQEFDRVTISRYCPQYFWVFDRAEVDFYDYSVPCDGVQFLEAIWQKYGNFISHFKLGIFVGGAMLNSSLFKRIGVGVTAEAAYGVVAGAVDDVVVKVVDAVILEIIENASNLQEIPAVGNSPQDRDCDLGRCETADFYELLLALMGVHHSFIVASANIVMIGKECMNVVGTIELIAGAIADQTYKVWCCSRTSCSRFMILEGDDLAFVVL
uniref:Uncharacterized protein n=1 Tax=Fagus sylvatica TaxID=28930 RepID=A0A2N9GLY7_FAGSY